MTPTEQIKCEISNLKDKLLQNSPEMPVLLRTIHTTLKKDAELVTQISEEEINVIVNGLLKQTNTTLISQVMKSKKSTKNLTLDDL